LATAAQEKNPSDISPDDLPVADYSLLTCPSVESDESRDRVIFPRPEAPEDDTEGDKGAEPGAPRQ
jgi:hypothetical protein